MRVTSDLFVSQLVRRVFSDGGFAAVERRGAEAAGAIFLLVRHRDGALDLYGPAAQTHSSEDGGRRFMREFLTDEAALEARLVREARFDPDFWVVEIETATPEQYVEIVEA
ncbi:hypothetical protein ASG43_01145 [Aureimonas sp. Leaf454]|uniref:DUF1491 family protein n=1 Tax=Aureimonas sp. Leaf454 TaxID=1736381 RepID=UPI0006F86A7B|nr:DUF1491 family protein [Aureimonas sp. Leaf454]KQT54259.1 hypothetical protein ASG43_01145 [Aureimonas sp. Leaf454]